MRDYYRLLEVSETASTEVIQAAYKIMAKKYHPDTAKPEEKAQREARMKEINQAKEILLNPEERRKYDTALMQERARLREESIRAKAERHKDKEKKKKNVISSRVPDVENAGQAVGGAFVGFFGLFRNFSKNKTLIIICAFLFLLAFVQLFLCFKYFVGEDIFAFGSSPVAVNIISPNKTTKQEIIGMYGNPHTQTNKYIAYKGNAKILIENDIVVGWIDTYQELNFLRYDKIPTEEDISIGMDKTEIIERWGMPDTYSKDIIVYYNLIIYFDNDNIIDFYCYSDPVGIGSMDETKAPDQMVSVSNDSGMSPISVAAYSVTGEMVKKIDYAMQKDYNETEFLQDVRKGMYVLHCLTGNQRVVKKVVVK